MAAIGFETDLMGRRIIINDVHSFQMARHYYTYRERRCRAFSSHYRQHPPTGWQFYGIHPEGMEQMVRTEAWFAPNVIING